MRRKFNPVLKIALTANTVEWFEFSLTAFMALEIGWLFFPASSDKNVLMLSFLVFASSYLARPLGSIFFGLLGSRRGTGPALKLSLLGMAIPASLIALLPTYQSVGYVATVLLLMLKVMQGFCAGGEAPLTGYYVSLSVSGRNRGLYCALAAGSSLLGMLLASGTIFALPYIANAVRLADSPISAYVPDTWRWPFLLCIPLSILVYSLRSSITVGRKPRTPQTARSRTARPLVQAFILVAFLEIGIYSLFVWMPSYLHSYLGVSSSDARLSNVAALLILFFSMVVSGYVSRFIDASTLAFVGIVSMALSVYPLFYMLQQGDFATLLAAQAAFAIMNGCLGGVIFVILPDLFKRSWGDFGVAITYSFSTALLGGTAPVVCAYLINVTGDLTAPAIYIAASGLLAAPVAYGVSRANRRQLVDQLPHENAGSPHVSGAGR
ncbi:MFS transporter [Pandoraea horticolens]|uniref:MFS transporter n=1 Tax=Pandoraea horticolens TaxID=2508298 RepID=A0A5E4WUV7_9BURK|nr:MFS transporter [Pandoraea horticolens]VVE27374.1 MFS transporter [Pandoraea horticolens]